MKHLLPFVFLMTFQFAGNNAHAQNFQGLSFSLPATPHLNIQQVLFNAIRFPNTAFFFQTDTGMGASNVEIVREERQPKNYLWWSIWVILGIAACMVIYFLIKKNPRKDVE